VVEGVIDGVVIISSDKVTSTLVFLPVLDVAGNSLVLYW